MDKKLNEHAYKYRGFLRNIKASVFMKSLKTFFITLFIVFSIQFFYILYISNRRNLMNIQEESRNDDYDNVKNNDDDDDDDDIKYSDQQSLFSLFYVNLFQLFIFFTRKL